MSELTTLKEWSSAQGANCADIFEYEFADVKQWSSITDNEFTREMLYEYLLHRYGDITMRNYTKSVLKALTRVWHNANRYKFAGFASTTQQEYNPIENYNRIESETVTDTPNLSENKTDTYSPLSSETMTEGGTTGTTSGGTSSVTGGIAPFDSSSFSNAEKSDGTTSGTETITHGKTVTHSHSGTDTTVSATTKTGTDTTERHSTTHGNIGVMSTQDMLKQEREIVDFAFLDFYLSEWVNAFCAGVWYSDELC